MKARRSLLSRIASTFRKEKPAPKPRKPGKKEPKVRGIEALEGRIAPATLIDASTIQYKDVGGDLVTVHFSKPLFTLGGDQEIANNKLDDIFKFSSGTFASDVEQDLQLIDLTLVKLVDSKNPANGISFTVETTGGTGDGSVKLGGIRATNLTLGEVVIDGDLGQIDVGAAASKIAIKSLTIDSLYANGLTSQTPTTTAADGLESKIVGGVKLLHVKGDLFGYFRVTDGNTIVNNDVKTTAPGNLTKAVIEGSLRGKAAVATTSDNTGSINVQGTIGSIEVLGTGDDANPQGLVGGGGRNSGSIVGAKTVHSITISDSLVGGGGTSSGSILAGSKISKVTVNDDFVGGAGANSATIQAAAVSEILVGDSIKGGGGENSGGVTTGGVLSKLTVTNDIVGGIGGSSGGIRAAEIGKAVINGSIIGGDGSSSGVVFAESLLRFVSIGEDIDGGEGVGSAGVLTNGLLKSVIVNGGVNGGEGNNSGFIGSQSRIGAVDVIGSITGGDGVQSGRIFSAGSIDKIEVSKVIGGVGDDSGSILAASDPQLGGTIKSATIALGVEGGVGQSSGTVQSRGDITKLTLGTKLQLAGLVGGEGDFSGSILAQGSIGKPGILIYGSVEGGTGDKSASIQAGGNAAQIQIRGGIIGIDSGATGEESGLVRVDGQLKSLIIDGGLENASVRVGADLVKAVIGSAMTDSTITAFGAIDPKLKTGDIAIGLLTVNGNVTDSQILAGYDVDGDPVNGAASIKSVLVTGNWTASDLVAGVESVDGEFGNGDDALIVSAIDRAGFVATIARVQILGSVAGSAETGDHFGFVTQQFGSFKVGSNSLAFTSVGGEQFALPSTDDVVAKEVTA